MWQFGELGYDESINRCEDGSIDDGCRVSPKPVHWDYREDANRYELYSHFAELFRLRNTYPVFTSGEALIEAGSSFVKQISLKNIPYVTSPADANQMNVVMIANFDVIAHTESLELLHPGMWFEFYSGQTISVSGTSSSMTLKPGEYRLYTDFPLKDPITGVEADVSSDFIIHPNPVQEDFIIDSEHRTKVKLYTLEGKEVFPKKRSDTTWSMAGFAPGFYIVEIVTQQNIKRAKIIKR
jgi:hypothetical protein